MKDKSIIIIGAGPAGLAAGNELVTRNKSPLILEAMDKIGGLSRTEQYKGYRFDIGGHRFFTKNPQITELWQQMLGDDLLTRTRASRIYYHDRYLDYPLRLGKTLSILGPTESLYIMLSYLKAKISPLPEEENLEQWMANRFGHRLYETFFKVYTEKVWGFPCSEIQADWAAQRISGLSTLAILTKTIFGAGKSKSLIEEFQFPRLGAGMMWERFNQAIEAGGGQVKLRAPVRIIQHQNQRVTSVVCNTGGKNVEYPADHILSSLPINTLVTLLRPGPPREVFDAARRLSFRGFVIVLLMVDKEDLFHDQWIYVHSPELKVCRIQNFRNWSPEMVPDSAKTGVGMEYYCNEGDDMWNLSDAAFVTLATRELVALGLAEDVHIKGGTVVREAHAYPIYDEGYKDRIVCIRNFLSGIENIQSMGRGGMHRYNNMDHSMVTGILAAQNVLGAKHDLWEVNEETEYLEEIS
jgi:protoporphyrinogen oxidase